MSRRNSDIDETDYEPSEEGNDYQEELYIQIEDENLDNVKEIVENTDINDKLNLDYALIKAAEVGVPDIVKYLIEKGADIHAEDDEALFNAFHNKNLKTLKYLIEQGADIYTRDEYLIKSGDEKIITFLVELNKIDLKSYIGNELLLDAIDDNNLELVKFLVEKGVDIHFKRDEAFLLAVESGNIAIVKYLIDKGADIHAEEDEALITPIKYGYINIFIYFFEMGAYNNIEDIDPLLIASEEGQIDIIRYLFKKNIYTEKKDEALKLAAKSSKLQAVIFLISSGAQIPSIKDIESYDSSIRNYLNSLIKYKKPLQTINDNCNNDLNDNDIKKIVKILNLNENIDKLTLCETLADIFNKKAEEFKNEILQCTNTTTVLLEDLKDIHPMYFYSYREGNKLFCDDIRELVKMDSNPWTKQTFSPKLKYNINKQYDILNNIVEKLNDDSEEIVMSITNTIRSVMNKVLSQLRYPKNAELFVNCDIIKLNSFIDSLYEENIISLNDKTQINKITTLENKKLTVANTLILKLEAETQFTMVNGSRVSALRVMLEEVYNNVF